MNDCFLLKRVGGGGNALADQSMVIRRTAAIGDVIASTIVADKLAELGYGITFQADKSLHGILRRHPRIAQIKEPGGLANINLDATYEVDPQRKAKHISTMFMQSANRQLFPRGIVLRMTNCTPELIVTPTERNRVRETFSKYEKPWIFICPRSQSFPVRTVPDGVWSEIIKRIPGTKFWIGLHPAPAGTIDLGIRQIDLLPSIISAADLMITTDTGPMHIAAALGIPIVALGQSNAPDLRLSDQRDFVTVWPDGLDCLNCQLNLCPKNAHNPPCQGFDADKVAVAVNGKLDSIFGDKVSAVISIYQPEVRTLNRCLESVLPQVDEVLVTRDTAGKIPAGTLQNPKIKYLLKPAHDIGYGPKQNFCARNSTGKWLLLLNDDVFLDANAVSRMREVMTDKVAVSSNLLRHIDGRIQHAGKVRHPGERGWGHIDFGQYHPTFKEPVELENVCGACVLVRRTAHFEAKGFDEDMPLFASDDDHCMKIRQLGWKIMFTPHSTGIHLEHQSVFKNPQWEAGMHKANAEFGRKWTDYFVHNEKRVPLGNFDYLNV